MWLLFMVLFFPFCNWMIFGFQSVFIVWKRAAYSSKHLLLLSSDWRKPCRFGMTQTLVNDDIIVILEWIIPLTLWKSYFLLTPVITVLMCRGRCLFVSGVFWTVWKRKWNPLPVPSTLLSRVGERMIQSSTLCDYLFIDGLYGFHGSGYNSGQRNIHSPRHSVLFYLSWWFIYKYSVCFSWLSIKASRLVCGW